MAIEKNRVTVVALIFLAVAGMISYLNLPQSEDPGFVIRTATVVTRFPGASPARVEQLVTDKLEKAIQEIPELDVVRSQSKTGVSVIFVDIQERYTDMRPIWDNLRRKVEKATSDLPGGIIGPTVNDEFGDVFGILMMLTGDGFSYRELKEVADAVRDELLLIQDVAKVEIFGAQDERLFVEYSNACLAELGLSPMQLQQILAARNIIIPGGDIATPYEKIVLEPSGNFESVDELRRTVINLPDSQSNRQNVAYLEDLVTITRGYIDPPTRKMRCAGEPCLGLSVSMREGGNIVELGQRVKAEMRRIESYYPIGLEFDYVQFQPEAVEKKVDEFVNSLLQAVGIVALVMLITLGLRTGLVVASLIPMAMVMSFLVMSLFDIGLDQMSLASLIIALGMLVDNAIVVSESIMVQMAAGRPRVEAAVASANELKIPLLTSSLTTAAAFLPVFLAESSTGEYTAPLFKVVTITLLCSWLLSLTMIPLFCVAFLKVQANGTEESFNSRFYRLYRGFLVGILRARWVFAVVVIGVFVLAMKGFGYIPSIFFPANDRPTFSADIELPVGTPIERTESVVRELDQFIQTYLVVGTERPAGVTNWAAFIGEGAPRYILSYGPEQASPGYAYMLLNTTSPWIMGDLIAPLEAFANANFPDLKATIRPLELGPPAWPSVAVRISGREPETLFDIVDQVKAKLRGMPGTKLIDDNWGARSKKFVVNVNEARARRAGVTNQDIAISLQMFLSGFDTTEYREGDKLIPVTLRSVEADRKDISKLETLNVYAQATGQSVPLTQVADIEVMWEPAKISRRNRLKTVTVEAGLEPGYTAAETNAVLQPWL